MRTMGWVIPYIVGGLSISRPQRRLRGTDFGLASANPLCTVGGHIVGNLPEPFTELLWGGLCAPSGDCVRHSRGRGLCFGRDLARGAMCGDRPRWRGVGLPSYHTYLTSAPAYVLIVGTLGLANSGLVRAYGAVASYST